MMEQKPLTIEELKEMAGQPVWYPDEEAYGIVNVRQNRAMGRNSVLARSMVQQR